MPLCKLGLFYKNWGNWCVIAGREREKERERKRERGNLERIRVQRVVDLIIRLEIQGCTTSVYILLNDNAIFRTIKEMRRI